MAKHGKQKTQILKNIYRDNLPEVYQLADPRTPLAHPSARYYVVVAGHSVRVHFGEKVSVIEDSPPPVGGRRNAITSIGELTVGWGAGCINSLCQAWVLVLEVLGLGEDGQPKRNSDTPVLHEVAEVTGRGYGRWRTYDARRKKELEESI